MGPSMVVVMGVGESTIAAIREAVQAASASKHLRDAAWAVATERKIGSVMSAPAEAWCVVVSSVSPTELERDPATLASSIVPGHSFLLDRYRSIARAEADGAGYVADRSGTGEGRSLFVTRAADGWGSAGDPDRGQRVGSRILIAEDAGPVFATGADARAEAKRRWARTR